MSWSTGDFEAQLAAERGAGSLFSGSGGDGVFFQARAELAVADYLFDHGMGRELLRVAVDAARISRESVWPMLFNAVRARVIPNSLHPLRAAGPSGAEHRQPGCCRCGQPGSAVDSRVVLEPYGAWGAAGNPVACAVSFAGAGLLQLVRFRAECRADHAAVVPAAG